MDYKSIEDSIKSDAIVLLPSGVMEQQGPHSPITTDLYVSYKICLLLKSILEAQGVKVLLAPPFYWGMNYVTRSFVGSFTTRKETVVNLLFDIYDSLSRFGVKHVFHVDTHGDHQNGIAIYKAITKARVVLGLDVRSIISNWIAKQLKIGEDDPHFLIFSVDVPDQPRSIYPDDVHAGKYVTATMIKHYSALLDQKKQIAFLRLP
ncbi:creatininase family protein [Brevibacillus daliensis]|uniref:creatininase family protein n=1 Tax=Brevibacillus daliensis TaxID=2892995 RepID=UPI001E369676|nr:creatininase family protein [Brevibacillus daliensis]